MSTPAIISGYNTLWYIDKESLDDMNRNSTLLSTVGSISPTTGSVYLSVGCMVATTEGYWYGTLADARIYSRALSSSEITTLHTNVPNP